jgi:hypothetical protein
MPSYLVEVYGGMLRREELPEASRRARVAAAELTRQGTPVRFLGSISVPEDEMCFYLYEGPSAAAVREASRRAAIQFERVVEAVPVDAWP